MKKMLSLLLALTMLLTACPAMAEIANGAQMLVSPDERYSLEVPEGYFELGLEILLGDAETQAYLMAWLDMDAAQLREFQENARQGNMLIVYSDDMQSSFNVSSRKDFLTMDLLTADKSQVDAVTMQGYMMMGVQPDEFEPMDLQVIGGRTWYALRMILEGQPFQLMMTAEDGVSYTAGFTNMDAQVIASILETFTLTEKEHTILTSSGQCSFSVPAEYFELNSETLDAYFPSEEMQTRVARLLGLQSAMLLKMQLGMMLSQKIVFSGDLTGRITLQETETILTMNEIAMIKSGMDEMLKQQFIGMGVPEERIRLMEIQTIGDHRWYGIAIEMNGRSLLQMMTLEDGVQYTFSFDNMDEDVCRRIMESFGKVQ